MHPAALALLEPLSQRYLTLIQGQLDAPIGRALAARQLSATAAAGQRAFVARVIAYVRAHGVAPPRLPSAVAQLFSPVNTRLLAQADRLDPAQLVAELPARLPVLISCSDTDQNIGCANVERLSAARPRAALGPGLIHQRNASHELALTAPRSAPSTAIPTPLPRTAALPRALAKLFSAQR